MPTQKQSQNRHQGVAYAVCGGEVFLRSRAAAALIDRVLGDADRMLALTEYDGSEASASLASVLDDLRTLPFLTDRRLVVVREADAFITRYRQELEDYLDSPSATGVLLLDCKIFPSNTRLYKRVAAVGEVTECKPIKAYAVPGWLTEHCRGVYGKRLDARAASLLCDQIGADLGLLDAELQKLALYVGERETIGADDVEKLTGRCREEQVWDILSAIGAGNRAKALADGPGGLGAGRRRAGVHCPPAADRQEGTGSRRIHGRAAQDHDDLAGRRSPDARAERVRHGAGGIDAHETAGGRRGRQERRRRRAVLHRGIHHRDVRATGGPTGNRMMQRPGRDLMETLV